MKVKYNCYEIICSVHSDTEDWPFHPCAHRPANRIHLSTWCCPQEQNIVPEAVKGLWNELYTLFPCLWSGHSLRDLPTNIFLVSIHVHVVSMFSVVSKNMASKRDCNDATAKGIRNIVASERKINVQNSLVLWDSIFGRHFYSRESSITKSTP